MKIAPPWEDRQLLQMVWTNRFISAPRLRMQMFRWFGRRMSVRTIRRRVSGRWILVSASKPDVLSSLWSTGDVAVSWGGGTECWTSDNGDTVSSVMSPGSPYTTVTVGSWCHVGKGRGWLMPASSLMMEIVARQSWMDPWTSIGTCGPWGIKCCHGRRGCLDVTCVLCAAFSHINLLPTNVKLECGTWYHHPRHLECVLSRNLIIFKVAAWYYRCRPHCFYWRGIVLATFSRSQPLLNMNIEGNFEATLWCHRWRHHHEKNNIFSIICDDLFISEMKFKLYLIFQKFKKCRQFELAKKLFYRKLCRQLNTPER